jgi:hypothetical protein
MGAFQDIDAGIDALAAIAGLRDDPSPVDIQATVVAVERLISALERSPPSPRSDFRIFGCDLAVAERDELRAAIAMWRADGSSDQGLDLVIEPARALLEALIRPRD